MKYTRYDYRRRKDSKLLFLGMFFCIIIAALLIGTYLSSVLYKNSSSIAQDNTSKSNKSNSNYQFILLQCGIFANKTYADDNKEKLSEVVIPFAVEEDGKTIIYSGIYEGTDADTVSKKLSEKSISNYKFIYEIQKKDETTQLLYLIIEGNLQILTQVSNKDFNGVVTSDSFKSYVKGLKTDEKDSANKVLLDDYVKYVNNMPEQIGKDKVEENYKYIYNLIKKIGIKKKG